MRGGPVNDLKELARLCGVEPGYVDIRGQRREASPEALLRVLRLLGAPVERVEDASDALRQRREARWLRRVEPVSLAWDGGPADVTVRMAASRKGRPLAATVFQ